ncbi:ABC transporter ATP-binding protein [Patescibacteria group bacterium]|nr:ABC transporter ATP-binding protein [Patescibacteria group bacterium]
MLQGVDIVVNAGEIYGFLGANGVGKTTLLKCIFHYLKHDAGDIQLFGTSDYHDQTYFARIGYAPEVTNLYPFLRGIELLRYMGKLAGMHPTLIEERAKMLLEKLGLSFAEDRLISAYSKGMKQRLSLAASLINDPELIFRDEPMSGLDPLGRIIVKDLMKELKKEGKTLFFNTHILSDVQEIADRFGILHK